jgi:hypothetical protein
MGDPAESFFVTGGTLRADAASYVEREADRQLLGGLLQGEFCYVLTPRQMGKSSLMVRTTQHLRQRGRRVVTFDLTALGQNLTLEQWYDGLLLRLGRQLGLEDELDAFWRAHERLGPCPRFFAALRHVALSTAAVARPGSELVVFIDELDVTRSLPFSTDELLASIRGCYNRRTEDPALAHLTFCLLGVATPAELIRDPRITPFNIGQRIELHDFTPAEAAPLARRLLPPHRATARAPEILLDRILHWTHGHPYLTQHLAREVAERWAADPPPTSVTEGVDALCEALFLGPRARETDDNLLYVRERLLRADMDLASLLELYEQVLAGRTVPDDELNDAVNQLLLAGIVRVDRGRLVVRNRIYERVFDTRWVQATKPLAELETPGGQRIRIRATCTLGRTDVNEVALPDAKVSRRHAVIQRQGPGELWLADLGSRNGTFVNAKRVVVPVLLRDRDCIDIGPFRLVFRQLNAPPRADDRRSTLERTVIEGPGA